MSFSLSQGLFSEIPFSAWKRGVELAGADYFGDGTKQALHAATGTFELVPNMEYITKAMRFMSPGQRKFIAAMTSFYDRLEGGSLLRQSGFEGLSDLGGLDLKRRQVISALILEYTDPQHTEAVSDSSSSSLFDEVASEQAHFIKAPQAFFSAWQQGARLAGADYFGSGTEQALKAATDKWELRPAMARIAKAMRFMSPGQRIFIAAMTSSYNSQDGGKLLRRSGFEGLSDFRGLDLERRKVIAALILNYVGF